MNNATADALDYARHAREEQREERPDLLRLFFPIEEQTGAPFRIFVVSEAPERVSNADRNIDPVSIDEGARRMIEALINPTDVLEFNALADDARRRYVVMPHNSS